VRILVLSNLFPNPIAPNTAPFNRHQVCALAEKHHVEVIAPIAWTDELVARVRRRRSVLQQRRVVRDGIVVHHPRYCFTPRVLRSFHGRFYEWSVKRCFGRVVERFRPDLIYTTWAYPDAWAGVRRARSAGLPVVVKVHGCDVLCGGRGLASDPARMQRTIECLRAADAVVTVSQHLARNVEALGVEPERIRTIYNGVDATIFHPGPAAVARKNLGIESDKRLIVFVGRLDPVKGLDVLLEACAKLRSTGADFKCYLVGDGPLRGALLDQIAKLKLDNVVQMPGAQRQSALGDWYRAADLVVAPSRSEGVPNVLIEASACGASFVASHVGGIEEIADRVPSRLVPPCDTAGLAGAIDELIREPIRASRRQVAPPRSHRDAAAELSELFEQVIRRHHSKAFASTLHQSALAGAS
jgi:glycosyltransferase involved in cell wall biosynthesis